MITGKERPITFMDEIKTYIEDFAECSDMKEVEELFKYMEERDYDTDSIKFDLQEPNSYICADKFGKELVTSLKDFIHAQSGYFYIC